MIHRNRSLRSRRGPGATARCRRTESDRILVVDDDPILRLVNAQILSFSGYQVDTAEDGVAAWEVLQVKSYDLLITDHSMPKLTGLELIKKLRSEGHHLPVIMVSGAIPTKELSRYPWLQLNAMLSKPYTGDELLGSVKKVLRRARNARERIHSENIANQSLFDSAKAKCA